MQQLGGTYAGGEGEPDQPGTKPGGMRACGMAGACAKTLLQCRRVACVCPYVGAVCCCAWSPPQSEAGGLCGPAGQRVVVQLEDHVHHEAEDFGCATTNSLCQSWVDVKWCIPCAP